MLQEKTFEENYASYLKARDQIFKGFRDVVFIHFRSIVLKDRGLQGAIASGDDYEIEDNSVPGFNRLKVEVPELKALTHYLADGKVLRREHSEEKGDMVGRPLVKMATKENKLFEGIEKDGENYFYFMIAPLTYRKRPLPLWSRSPLRQNSTRRTPQVLPSVRNSWR